MNDEQASKLKPGDRVRVSLLGGMERTVKSVEYVRGATLQKRYEITVKDANGNHDITYHQAYVYPAGNDI